MSKLLVRLRLCRQCYPGNQQHIIQSEAEFTVLCACGHMGRWGKSHIEAATNWNLELGDVMREAKAAQPVEAEINVEVEAEQPADAGLLTSGDIPQSEPIETSSEAEAPSAPPPNSPHVDPPPQSSAREETDFEKKARTFKKVAVVTLLATKFGLALAGVSTGPLGLFGALAVIGAFSGPRD